MLQKTSESYGGGNSQVMELLNQVLANSEKIRDDLKEVERLVASRTV